MKKELKTVKRLIKEIRESQKDMREVGVLSNNYDYKEAPIYRKGWNDALKWQREFVSGEFSE